MASILYGSSAFSTTLCYPSRRINAAIHVPKLSFPAPKVHLKRNVIEEVLTLKDGFRNIVLPVERKKLVDYTSESDHKIDLDVPIEMKEMYVLLEAVSDRVAMHDNVGEQRNNWNTLLLNSINMITLNATTMSGIAAAASASGAPHLALSLSSTLLFSAATAMLVIMNKIQPSQLAEEQRNASRLFRQLQASIETLLALKTPSREDVNEIMEKILALDRAYPLPLLGTMIEKFPDTFQTSAWWPQLSQNKTEQESLTPDHNMDNNGWSDELEKDMRQVVEVLKSKDGEEYMRLGSLALKVSKVLAISGPLLSSIAAVGSAFVGSSHGSFAPVVAVAAGALASTVNAIEHGGQVGMVVEMYRCCGGFFRLLGDTIESTLEENDLKKRENGEVFEMKVALQLGRSLSELRELASKNNIDEFASKLF